MPPQTVRQSSNTEGSATLTKTDVRSWRLATSREHGVRAYVIFHDGTLKEIARAKPTTMAALGGLSGVGEKKLEAYGQEIVAIVARHEAA